ncbi:MAG: hypothetical protein M3H12_20710 [Chromatiales bacterium]
MASLGSVDPIEFIIPILADDYLDLASMMLLIHANVTRADRTDLDAADPVVSVNN